MPLPSLESFEPALGRACADVLGDTIAYAADGTNFTAIRAYADYRELSRPFQQMEAISQDISIALLKADVAERPSSAARLMLGRLPGRVFKPVAVRSDDSGTHWEFEVKDVPVG